MLSLICWIAALVIFLIAASNLPVSRINLTAAGLALCVMAVLATKYA